MWIFAVPLVIAFGYGLLVICATSFDFLKDCWIEGGCAFGGVPLARFAEFGDSFGVITSLFSGLAFAAAWHLINLQKKELEIIKGQLDDQGKNALTNVLVSEWGKTVREARSLYEKYPNNHMEIGSDLIFPAMRQAYELRDSVDRPMLVKLIQCDIVNYPEINYVSRLFFSADENAKKEHGVERSGQTSESIAEVVCFFDVFGEENAESIETEDQA